MIERSVVVAEARTWLGTPFQHATHTRGLATDCGGVVGGVGVAVGALPADFWQVAFAPFAGYAPTPANGVLERVLRTFLQEIDPAAAQAGDVVLMRFSEEPQHLGILVPYVYGGLSLIHAWSRATPVPRVVEHRMGAHWPARVTHAFAYPGVV